MTAGCFVGQNQMRARQIKAPVPLFEAVGRRFDPNRKVSDIFQNGCATTSVRQEGIE